MKKPTVYILFLIVAILATVVQYLFLPKTFVTSFIILGFLLIIGVLLGLISKKMNNKRLNNN